MAVVGGGVLPRTSMEPKSVWVSSLEGGPRSEDLETGWDRDLLAVEKAGNGFRRGWMAVIGVLHVWMRVVLVDDRMNSVALRARSSWELGQNIFLLNSFGWESMDESSGKGDGLCLQSQSIELLCKLITRHSVAIVTSMRSG